LVVFEDPLLRDWLPFAFLDFLECDDFFDRLNFDSTDVKVVSVSESKSLDDEEDGESDEEESSS
jgi:hypothetical protein